MSLLTEQAKTQTFCVNHPATETYLRCNKCGKPVCIKCVQRTPVGYRCNECLGVQRAGYYNASALDYGIAAIIGLALGALGGFVMSLIGGFWIVGIFAGPFAGGIISEAIRRSVSKRRGRYLWLAACAAVALGGVLALLLPGIPFALARGSLALMFQVSARGLLNIGFWIFLVLALSTTYARLRH